MGLQKAKVYSSNWQRSNRAHVMKMVSLGSIQRIEQKIEAILVLMNRLPEQSLAPEVNEWMCRVAESACANLLEVNRRNTLISIPWNFKRMYRTTIPKMSGVVAFQVTYLPELKYKGHMSRYLREYYNDRIEAVKARTTYTDLSYRNDVPWEIVRYLQGINGNCDSVVKGVGKVLRSVTNPNRDKELLTIHKIMMKYFLIANEYILRPFEDGEYLCKGKYDYFKMQGRVVNRYGYK